MQVKHLIEELLKYDPESDCIISDKEGYPSSISGIDIGKLGVVEDHYVIDEMIFEDQDVEFDDNHSVKDVVVIKIQYGGFE